MEMYSLKAVLYAVFDYKGSSTDIKIFQLLDHSLYGLRQSQEKNHSVLAY